MKKIVIKAVCVTFSSVLAILLLFLIAMSLLFPSVMAETTAKLGFYKTAAHYSIIEYDRSGKIEDIAMAYEYAVFSEDDQQIVTCGTKYMGHESFAEECKNIQYVAGNLSVSLYRIGNVEEAIECAFSASPAYSAGCAIKYLCVEVASVNDTKVANRLLQKLSSIEVQAPVEYERIIVILQQNKTN